MDTKERFRANLPYYMKRAGMNQIELAKAVGKSESSVSLWLSGGAFPRIDTIQKIADVLGCRTDDLLIEQRTLNFMDQMISAPQAFDSSVLEDQRILFRLAKNAKPEAIRAAVAVLKSMEGEENDL